MSFVSSVTLHSFQRQHALVHDVLYADTHYALSPSSSWVDHSTLRSPDSQTSISKLSTKFDREWSSGPYWTSQAHASSTSDSADWQIVWSSSWFPNSGTPQIVSFQRWASFPFLWFSGFGLKPYVDNTGDSRSMHQDEELSWSGSKI